MSTLGIDGMCFSRNFAPFADWIRGVFRDRKNVKIVSSLRCNKLRSRRVMPPRGTPLKVLTQPVNRVHSQPHSTIRNGTAAGCLQRFRDRSSMLHSRTLRSLTQACFFQLAWGTWSGWSFIAQDRELRFVAVEFPPPAC